MTDIMWDQDGARVFESGVDRGVLYPAGGSGVPWNGLVSVEEKTSDGTAKTYYIDGLKYLDQTLMGDYAATLQAFTYPEEFEKYNGFKQLHAGVLLSNQPSFYTFGLSYRTKVGNDIDGLDHGYKLHLLFNLIATPSDKQYQSNSEQNTPVTFSWDLRSVPEVPDTFSGYKPTSHLILESNKIAPAILTAIEHQLYSTKLLLPLSEILGIIDDLS